jgi:hypothetical protein
MRGIVLTTLSGLFLSGLAACSNDVAAVAEVLPVETASQTIPEIEIDGVRVTADTQTVRTPGATPGRGSAD